MSFTKLDRKVQSISKKQFPERNKHIEPGQAFASIVAAALKRQFLGTPSALKSIAKITGANERSVKNWLTGKNGPSGENLVILARHSDEVLEAILLFAGRGELVANKKLLDARQILGKLLTNLDELLSH